MPTQPKEIALTQGQAAALKSLEAIKVAAEQRKAEYEQALAAHTAALEQHLADLDSFVREVVEGAGETYDGVTWELAPDGSKLITK